MDLVELTNFLVSNIVKEENRDKIVITETKEENETIILIKVLEEDMSAVIGSKGLVANSIRTIVQAIAYNSKLGRVRVNIDSL